MARETRGRDRLSQPPVAAPRLAQTAVNWQIEDMTSVVELYEALASAPDEKTRAKLIAEAFERLEERYPHLPDLATQGHLRESELRLQEEIHVTQGHLRESELRLQEEIQLTRGRIRESELRLQKEIEDTKGQVRESELRLQKEIQQVRADLETKIEMIRADLKGDIEEVRSELKTDIEQMRSELKTDIEQIRSEVKTDIERAKTDLIKWLVPMMFAQVAVIAALVKLL